MQTESPEVVEYISPGAAAKLIGYTDTRSIAALVRAGEVAAIRLPSGQLRIDKGSLLAAIERFKVAS